MHTYPIIIQNKCGKFAICKTNNKFMVAAWNPYYNNWVRRNKRTGSGVHRNLDVLTTDNLGGGPILTTLRQAKELIEQGGLSDAI